MTQTVVAVLSAAHGHAEGYLRRLRDRRDVAVLFCDEDAPADEGLRGRALADQLGVTYVGQFADLLAQRPDAAVVCSENARHRGLVEAAIAAGCHVLCEKPLATTVEDARAMVEAAQRAGVQLSVAFPVRHAPSYKHLAASVKAGVLGDVLSILGTNNGMLPRDRGWFVERDESGGGSIVDHVVHCADLVDGLLGAAPHDVRAVANRILAQDPPTEVETGGLITATYPGGVIVSIDCSWSQPTSAPTWGGLTLDVIGTRGRIRIDPFAQHVGGYGQGRPQWWAYGADLDAAMLDDFIDSVQSGGTRRPVVTPEAGLRTVQVMCAALESAAAGGAVVALEA